MLLGETASERSTVLPDRLPIATDNPPSYNVSTCIEKCTPNFLHVGIIIPVYVMYVIFKMRVFHVPNRPQNIQMTLEKIMMCTHFTRRES